MTHRHLKIGYFALAAMNTLATSYYFNYLFFFLRDEFGYGDRENLWVSALHGFIYMFAAWQGGRFAERHGQLLSLKLGFGTLAGVVLAGALLPGIWAQLAVVVVYSGVLLFTWPALESLVSERESRAGVQQMVGIYNCTWAGAASLAYFTGGSLYDAFGKGAIFGLPAILFAAQFFVAHWLAKRHDEILAATPIPPREAHPQPEEAAFRQPVNPQAFLKMAWLASPFAYIAIYTLLAVMPGIAQKLGLSPTRVGLFCSVWLFGRLAAFAVLWRWHGWHYRFRWLLGAFVMLIVSFTAILLASDLWIVVMAQVALGFATGLIYYSSLFYAMDVGEAGSEHGGMHEAFIGLGIFLGPAVAALALQSSWRQVTPEFLSIAAVDGLLLLGLAGLIGLRWWRWRR